MLILLVLKHIKNLDLLLGMISLTGSVLLFYFGYKDLKIYNINLQPGDIKSNSFKKGLLTNLFNPHPYVFWFFIGVPFMIKGNTLERVAFVLSFLSSIVGSKIALALVVGKGKAFIKSKYYLRMIKFLGLILIFFGVMLLKDALGYLLR
jgi:threonine/homoserine/homoserine lactone efflux protein